MNPYALVNPDPPACIGPAPPAPSGYPPLPPARRSRRLRQKANVNTRSIIDRRISPYRAHATCARVSELSRLTERPRDVYLKVSCVTHSCKFVLLNTNFRAGAGRARGACAWARACAGTPDTGHRTPQPLSRTRRSGGIRRSLPTPRRGHRPRGTRAQNGFQMSRRV